MLLIRLESSGVDRRDCQIIVSDEFDRICLLTDLRLLSKYKMDSSTWDPQRKLFGYSGFDFDIVIMTPLALSNCALGGVAVRQQAKRYYLGK